MKRRTNIACLILVVLAPVMEFAGYGNKPGFIENKGQIVDQNYNPNPDVLYLLNAPGMNVQLRKTGWSYDLYSPSPSPSPVGEGSKGWVFHRIDMELVGADLNCKTETTGTSAGFTNYYTTGTPSEGVTGVRSFETVNYRNLYPGVDFQFITSGDTLFKYNIIIHPGGSLSSVKIRVSGAATALTSKGSLRMITPLDTIEEVIPFSAYVEAGEAKSVRVTFHHIGDGMYGLSTDREIPSGATLIIDPLPDRVWGTYFGGSGNELFGNCKVHRNGNFYISGSTSSSSNIATSGAHQVVYMGQGDAFLAKFNIDGEIQWATYYGGTEQDNSISCSLSLSEEVYLCGMTYSETNIATPGAFQTVKNAVNDAYLAKFGSDGLLIWGTYYGGNLGDYGNACCMDLGGNIYLVGETSSTTGIASPGAFQGTINGSHDAFMVKFTSTGNRLWSTYYGGEGMERASCCTIDSVGHLFVGGRTNSLTGMASPACHQTVYGGGFDGFLTGFTQDGQRTWGTYYGGEGDDDIRDCTASLWGDLFIAGETFSSTNISSPGSYQTTLSGITDGLAAKFNPEGTRIWGTYYGGSAGEWLNSCAMDDSVNLYLAGPTTSSGLATPGAYQLTLINGSQTCIVAKFDSAGQRKWATYYGGGGADHGWCDVDTSWNIYVCGLTASPTQLSTPGSYQPGFGGGTFDSFLARFTQCMTPATAGVISGPYTVCKSVNSVAFTVPPVSGASQYSWHLPPGATLTGGFNTDSISVQFGPASSSGYVSVRGINYCDTGDSSYLFIHVNDSPYPLIAGSDSLCALDSSVYTTAAGMLQYQWNISPGGIILTGGSAADSSVTVTWSDSGPHWIEASYSDTSGCPAYMPAHKAVTISDRLQVNIVIAASDDTVCVGEPVTFSATLSNGGSTPSCEWLVNGIITGINSPVFSYAPTNGDQVQCILTSSLTVCISNNPASSNTIPVVVNPLLPVGVTVSASANAVCAGTPVTFTAFPVNGGTTPAFQWIVNGINQGTSDSIFTYVPDNGDSITCVLTSSNTICTTNNPATSNAIRMTVYPDLPVSISISAAENPVCEGDTAIFTGSTTNKGSLPFFQWFVNDNPVGTNDSIVAYSPSNGDQVYCVLTSSQQCTSNNPATSDTVILVVNPLLIVGVNISASINPVCEGLPVTFTALPINGGANPMYQWKVNAVNAGINNAVFTYIPENADAVSCTLTSSEPCTTSNPATSNEVSVTVVESPEVTFTPCFDTITTTNAKPIRLRGGIPLGGTYSGTGVLNGYFYPSVAGPGNHLITYTYTNSALCTDAGCWMLDARTAAPFSCGNLFMDIRDSSVYPTIKIGSQCWMAANLNYGTMISSPLHQRDNCMNEKYCFQDLSANCNQQGALYQWDEIMRYDDTPAGQGICPPGWHVPSEPEWNQLFSFFGNNAFAGAPLRYDGYSGFNSFLYGAGFFNREWRFPDFATFFWSSTAYGTTKAWAHGMNDYNPSVSLYPAVRVNGFSVRCLKDN